jgi:hypothetical protein
MGTWVYGYIWVHWVRRYFGTFIDFSYLFTDFTYLFIVLFIFVTPSSGIDNTHGMMINGPRHYANDAGLSAYILQPNDVELSSI